MKILQVGDTITDCVSNKEYVLTDDFPLRFKSIVYAVTSKGLLKRGYTIENTPYEIRFKYGNSSTILTAVSNEIFPEDKLLWDASMGLYIYIGGKYDGISFSVNKYGINRDHYASRMTIYYSAERSINRFSEKCKNLKGIFSKSNTDLIPYTFGVELESCDGMIPFDECQKAGLIPLRDGSISGLEYATIVLDPSKCGFERLKYCLNLMNKYTRSNKDCSLHIHFGGIPLKLTYLHTVNKICKKVENEIMTLLPELAFFTSEFKSTGKDYCLPLKSYRDNHHFYSEHAEQPYLGSLEQSHVRDIEGSHKWQIHQRYRWCNMVNAMFYNKNKTIEFRCLAPSTNFNKIAGWIFIFSAILKYSEIVCKDLSECEESTIPKTLSLMDVFNAVYPSNTCNDLEAFMNDLKVLRLLQEVNGDTCGSMTEMDRDERIFKECILV